MTSFRFPVPALMAALLALGTACGGGSNPANPCQRTGDDTDCDGVDDDCDGAADDGYVPVATACGVGACAATGSSTCTAGSVGSTCTPGTPAASDATCNAVDDDCSGAADEDYLPSQVSCGVGACVATAESSCLAGVEREAACVPGTPAANDLTCDGADDDCDGSTDEDVVGQTVVDPGGVATAGLYDAHWFLGNAVIDWRSFPPAVACPAAGEAFEGSSTWSDPATGALLYYSNGLTVWNAAGAVTGNGAGLLGDPTATETSLFVPVPGTGPGRLLVFSNDTSSVFASVLDLATGEVDPATKNTPVATGAGEAMGAVDDGAGGFHLVLFAGAKLDAYRFTDASVPAAPAVSSDLPVTVDAVSRGTIRFSPDGTRIAIAVETPPGHWWAAFDPAAGAVLGTWKEIDRRRGYSIDFSPDGRQVYFAADDSNPGWSATTLWQHDTAGGTTTPVGSGSFSGVALAPDGNVYAAPYLAGVLGRVVNPDVGGPGNWRPGALDLAGCAVQYNFSKQVFLPFLVGGCQSNAQCDDGNPLTRDVCGQDGACRRTCLD